MSSASTRTISTAVVGAAAVFDGLIKALVGILQADVFADDRNPALPWADQPAQASVSSRACRPARFQAEDTGRRVRPASFWRSIGTS